MPFRPAAMTPPPATLQARRPSGFGSASRRGGPSGFPAVRATMDGGGCYSVANKLPGASITVSTNFANCLIFFGQEINRRRTRRNTNSNAKARRRGVLYDTDYTNSHKLKPRHSAALIREIRVKAFALKNF
jgi:hypothetical protein